MTHQECCIVQLEVPENQARERKNMFNVEKLDRFLEEAKAQYINTMTVEESFGL